MAQEPFDSESMDVRKIPSRSILLTDHGLIIPPSSPYHHHHHPGASVPATVADTPHDRWTQHIPTLRRLYVDEDMALPEVMKIMKKEHNFTATNRMYKEKFKRWGWRKNIRTNNQDDQILSQAAELSQRGVVQLANGQLVEARRLLSHLERKQRERLLHDKRQQKKKQQQQRHAEAVAATGEAQSLITWSNIRSPDTFRIWEALFHQTKTYVRGRYEGVYKAETLDSIRLGMDTSPGLDWNLFIGHIVGHLMSDRVNEALVLMRKAPDEFRSLLQCHPTNIISLICVFVIPATGRMKPKDPVEARHFGTVLKALLYYGSTITAESTITSPPSTTIAITTDIGGIDTSTPQENPSYGPLSQFLRLLSAASDTEELHQLAGNVWRLSCHTWDGILPGSTSLLLDWLNLGDQLGLSSIPFDMGAALRRTLRHHEAAYGVDDYRCIEVLTLLIYYTSILDDQQQKQQQQKQQKQLVGVGRSGTSGNSGGSGVSGDSSSEDVSEVCTIPAAAAATATTAATAVRYDEEVVALCHDVLRRNPQKTLRRFQAYKIAAQIYFNRREMALAEAHMRAAIGVIREERGSQDPDVLSLASLLENWMWQGGDEQRATEAASWRAELLASFEGDDDEEVGEG